MSCMHSPNNNRRHPLYGRVAGDTNLGQALLIAETEDGHYEPTSVIASINEAREMAADDMRARMRNLEKGGAPSCPEIYKVWSRDYEGRYAVICQLDAATLDDVAW